MEKDNSTYSKQILDAIILIEEYVTAVSKDQFLKDRKLQDSVAMRPHLIGEISNKLSDDFKKNMSEIAWDEIVGLRSFCRKSRGKAC